MAGEGIAAQQMLQQQAALEQRNAAMQNMMKQQAASQIMRQIATSEVQRSMALDRQRGQALQSGADRQARRDVGQSRMEMQKDLEEKQKLLGLIGGAAEAAGALGGYLQSQNALEEAQFQGRMEAAALDPEVDDFSQFNPEDVAALQAMSKAQTQADADAMVFDEAELAGVMGDPEVVGRGQELAMRQQSLEDLTGAAQGAMSRPSARLDQLYSDAAREQRQQDLQFANDPDSRRMRRAVHTPQLDAMPTEAEMNPEDLAALKELGAASQMPLQGDPSVNIGEEITGEVGRVESLLDTIQAAKEAMGRPSGRLEELRSDAARERRQQDLQFANDPDSRRMRRAVNRPQLDTMVTPSQMNPSDLGELMELGAANQVPMEFDERDVAQTAAQLEQLQVLREAGELPQSYYLDQLYRERDRERRMAIMKALADMRRLDPRVTPVEGGR